ncbi:hypothetical protein, partial [Solemya elarraichensis gill symbiont]|uniref:hypothetical protein n=1 Tax=Solemya elarraichensis gill symbiont TaxID=1918949 RepID=UPI001C2C3488
MSAVAGFISHYCRICDLRFFENLVVVFAYVILDVRHTGIADFDFVSVKDFTQWVFLIKTFVNCFQKCSPNVGFYVGIPWWVVPYYV